MKNLWRGKAATKGDTDALPAAMPYLLVPALKFFGQATRTVVTMDVKGEGYRLARSSLRRSTLVLAAGTRLRWLSLLSASVTVWSCTYQKPASSSPPSEPIQMEAFSEVDPVHLARALERECKKATPRSECYERLLESAASSGRVRLAMGALGQLGATDPDVQASGHVYAHAIGIAAGKRPGGISETFGQCSESYQSGCYHGVIQARFAALGNIGPGEVNGICEPFMTNESKRWIRFQCVHGVGHGLTTLNDHDLVKALSRVVTC